MANKKDNKEEKSTLLSRISGAPTLPQKEESAPVETDMNDPFGIPIAQVSSDELEQALNNTSNMVIPKKVVNAYDQAGWKVKFIRTKKGGSQDAGNIAKYLEGLGGAFISYAELKNIDPVYAKSFSPSKFTSPFDGKNTDILMYMDTALVRYKKQLADNINAKRKAQRGQALDMLANEARSKGLTVDEMSDEADDTFR